MRGALLRAGFFAALAGTAWFLHQRQVRQACPTGEPLCGHYAAQRMAELAGVPLSLSRALREMPPTVEGNSLAQIASLLQRAGVPVRHRRVQLAQLTEADYPALAYLVGPNHFVVLLGKTEGGYAVYDAHGRRKNYRASALEARWSGNVLTMARREVRPVHSREEAPRPPAQSGRIARHGASQPRVRFESLLADVGTVYVGQKGIVAEFRVRNAGGKPLRLWPAHAQTAADPSARWELPEQPIPPGGEVPLRIVFDVPPVAPSFLSNFYLRTNDPLQPVVRLTAGGLVKQPYRLEPTYVDLGDVVVGSTARRAVFFSAEVEEMPELSAECTLRGAVVSMFPLDDAQRASGWWPVAGQPPRMRTAVRVIEVAYTAEHAGEVRGELLLRAGGDVPFQQTVRLRGRAVEAVVATPSIFLFGEVQRQRAYQQEVVVAAREGGTFEVLGVRRPPGVVVAQSPRAQPARQFKFKLRGRGEHLLAASGAKVEVDVLLPQQNRTVTLAVPVYAQQARAEDRR